MPDRKTIELLERQIANHEESLRNFMGIQKDLRSMRHTAQRDHMLDINAQTILAIERSADILRTRLKQVSARSARVPVNDHSAGSAHVHSRNGAPG